MKHKKHRTRVIRVKQITPGTIFMFVFIGRLFSTPLYVIMIVFNSDLSDSVDILTPLIMLLVLMFVFLIFTIILDFFMLSFGLWLFSKFSTILIRYIPIESD